MKKFIFIFAALFLGIGISNAQGPARVAVDLGLPVGDISDFSSFALAVHFAYLFEVSEDVEVGPEVGYSTFFMKDIGTISIDNESFIPIKVKVKWNFNEQVAAEGGVGYGVGLNDGNDGGLAWGAGIDYNPNAGAWGLGVGYSSIRIGSDVSADVVRFRVSRSW